MPLILLRQHSEEELQIQEVGSAVITVLIDVLRRQNDQMLVLLGSLFGLVFVNELKMKSLSYIKLSVWRVHNHEV